MNTCIILGYTITMGLAEAIIFLVAAVLLGFSIHFYWFGKRSVNAIQKVFPLDDNNISEDDRWRLQFYEQLEQHEKNEERLEKELARMADAEKVLLAELEETRDEVERLEKFVEKRAAAAPEVASNNKHISELVIAQQNFTEYLSKEMTERLEKTYREFNFLQEKMSKIQDEAINPAKRNFEVDEMEQAYFRITKEYDELKLRYLNLMEENQKLTRILADTEEKLRDANFHKQQSGKKVLFLEEMVKDLQELSGHTKKLEIQLNRITEIESLLNKTIGENKKL